MILQANRLQRHSGASLETWEFGYDVTNRLIAVSKRATDGGTLQLRVDYKYDALGRRIERYEDSNGDGNTDVRERFGYDGEHVWADLDGSNNLTYRRLFGAGIDTPEVRVSAGGTVAWYLRDYQNSVIGMVDSSGSSLGTRSYSGYGQELSDTLGANGDRYGYTAREEDGSTGLSYYRARFYDPALGRWISTDPIGFSAGDANLYRYVGNGPTNGVDPSGLWTISLGISFEVQFGVFHFTVSADLHLGYSSQGLSVGAGLDISPGVGAGAGGSIGPTLTFTTAPTVGHLHGLSHTVGGFGGPVSVTLIQGGPADDHYYGATVGLGWGFGGGGYVGAQQSFVRSFLIPPTFWDMGEPIYGEHPGN